MSELSLIIGHSAGVAELLVEEKLNPTYQIVILLGKIIVALFTFVSSNSIFLKRLAVENHLENCNHEILFKNGTVIVLFLHQLKL